MDKPPAGFLVPVEALATLGKATGMTSTRISPFRYQAASALTPEQQQDLRTRGVLDAAGRPTGDAAAVLWTLASARNFIRFRASIGRAVIEHIVYASPDDHRTASVTPTPDGLLLRSPAPSDEIAADANECCGGSTLRSSEFEFQGKVEAGLTLAACLDVHRSLRLRRLAEGGVAAPLSFEAKDVEGFASRERDTAQSVLTVAKAGLDGSGTLSAEVIQRELQGLSAAGLLARSGAQFSLSGDAAELCESLLVVDGFFSLAAGRETAAGEVLIAEWRALQSGPRCLLTVDPGENGLHFQCVAPGAFIERLRLLLTDPAALESMERAGTAPAPLAEGTVDPFFTPTLITTPRSDSCCPNCRSVVPLGGQFCTQCGAKLRA